MKHELLILQNQKEEETFAAEIKLGIFFRKYSS